MQIPSELLPKDGRFGAGPSKVRPAQLEALVANDELFAPAAAANVSESWKLIPHSA